MKSIVTITAISWFSTSFAMEVVHELIYLLDRYSVRHIDVITNPRTAPDKKESRYHDYYVGMRDARWANDAEAAQAFGMEPDSKNWQRFKNEVKKRVANSLLFIEGDEQNMSEYGKALITATQNWAVAKVCQARGAKKSFIEFANKSLEIAIKYDLLDLAFEICNALKSSYFANATLRKEFLKMSKMSEYYSIFYTQEIAIKNEFQNFSAPLVDKKGTRLEAANEACRIVEKFRYVAKENNFLIFNYHYRMLDVYSSLLANKWAEALTKITEAQTFFKSKPFLHYSYYSAFLQQEAVCSIMLKNYVLAKEVINSSLVFHIEGTLGWFKSYELQAVNYFYSRNYQEAWNTYKLVTKHKLYNVNVTPLDKETWRLFYAYLVMLIRHNKIQVSPREKGEVEKFRLSSWINDITMLGLDKRGSNIPVIIFQALYYFLEDKIDDFDGRVDSLTKYRQRNLDTANEHFRTECFAELLELLRDHAHNHKTLMERSTPVLRQLSSVSTDLLDSSFELEVMPYEHQWEWLMAVYDGRRRGEK